jgi:hypothetical protein
VQRGVQGRQLGLCRFSFRCAMKEEWCSKKVTYRHPRRGQISQCCTPKHSFAVPILSSQWDGHYREGTSGQHLFLSFVKYNVMGRDRFPALVVKNHGPKCLCTYVCTSHGSVSFRFKFTYVNRSYPLSHRRLHLSDPSKIKKKER